MMAHSNSESCQIPEMMALIMHISIFGTALCPAHPAVVEAYGWDAIWQLSGVPEIEQ